jgi:hypothetical protein
MDNTFDAIGILLCIRLNSQNLRIMQKKTDTMFGQFFERNKYAFMAKVSASYGPSY